MLEILEFRGAPSDMAGNLPAFAMAAALPTPAVVMANGWPAGAPSVTAAPTDGSASVQIVGFTSDSTTASAITTPPGVDPSLSTTVSNSSPPKTAAADPTATLANDAVFTDAAATGPDLFQNPLGVDPVTGAPASSPPAQPPVSADAAPAAANAGGSNNAVNASPLPSVSTDNAVAAPAAPASSDAGFPPTGQPSNANNASNPAPAQPPAATTPNNKTALQTPSAGSGATAPQLSPEFAAFLASMASTPTSSAPSATPPANAPEFSTTAPTVSATIAAANAPLFATPTAPTVSANTSSPPTVAPQGTTDAASAASTQTANAPNVAASTPAVSAAAAAPQIVSTYHRHYTDSGYNDFASFYLEVTIDEQTNPDPANPAATLDHGTVTYTASFEMEGVTIYDYTNVVTSFSSSSTGPLLGSGGDSTAADALTGLGGGGTQIWNHEEWNEDANSTAHGSVTGASGPTLQVSGNASLTDWWTTDHTVVPSNFANMLLGLSPGGSTTDAKAYGSTSSNDFTVSDLAAGLPTPGPVPPGSYPTDLLAAPPAGATYLVRSFNSGSTDGHSTATTPFGGSTTVVSHDHYTGSDGYRDFETYNVSSGDATNAANPATDETSGLLNYQREGAYGGTSDSNLTLDGLLNPTGSVTNENHDSGTILANQSDFTDVYHRDNGHTVSDGTFTANSGDALTPSTYNDRVSTLLEYDGSLLPVTDELSYRYAQSFDTDFAVSDNSTVTVTTSPGSTSVGSTTTGSPSVSVTGTRHWETVVSAVLNNLDHTSTADSSGSYVNHSDFNATDHQHFSPTDASTDRTTDSQFTGSATASGDYSLSGGVSAAGQQTDGSSHVHVESDSDNNGKVTTVTTGTGAPVLTSVVKTDGAATSDATGDMTYNTDGTTNGSVTTNADNSSGLETTVTANGDYAIPNGTGSANDLDHRKTHDHFNSHTDITLTYGLASGSASSETDHRTDFDHSFTRTLDVNDDSLHSTITSDGAGSVATTDAVDASVNDGIVTGTRTFDYKLHDVSGSHLTANGNLADANGHTGTWTFDASSTDTIGGVSAPVGIGVPTADPNGQDGFHQTLVWQNGSWVATAPQTVTVGDAGAKTSRYHQDDNGVGTPPPVDSTLTVANVHTRDVNASLNTLNIQSGQPTDYTFQTMSHQNNTSTEAWDRRWSDGQGSSGHYDAITANIHSLVDDHHGSAGADGVTQDQIHQVKGDSSNATVNTQDSGSQYHNEAHHVDSVSLQDTRDGNMTALGSGTGSRVFTVDHRYWWSQQNATGTSSGGNEIAPPYTHTDSLNWGAPVPFVSMTYLEAFWQDFINSPEAHWLGEHAGDFLRVAGGAIDFGVGFTMTLGSGGLAAFPGVGLMAIGIDQIFVGETAIAFGVRPPSIFESLGSFGATGLGADPQTAQIVGTSTPAALSLLFTLGGGLLASSAAAEEATVGASLASGSEVQTLTQNNGIFEVLSEQSISGTTRSAHRAAANGGLLQQLEADAQLNRQFGEVLGVEDVAAQMRTGKGALRNPLGTEWHHPIDGPDIMMLLRRQVHRDPALQAILHPDNIGGFGTHFGD